MTLQERLRSCANREKAENVPNPIFAECLDRLNNLEAENARLREALTLALRGLEAVADYFLWELYREQSIIARHALVKETP